MEPLTSEQLLGMRFISYATPLALARRWLQSGEERQKNEALALLKGLFNRYPHSLEIGQQLALAYLEIRKADEAKAILDKLTLLCRHPNEEVQSRCGRLYRDQGDRYVKYPEIGGKIESPDDALSYYYPALTEYTKAYDIRAGHYPGINVATLHLLVGAFESNETKRDSNLKTSQNIARKLLDGRVNWPREMDDDSIWHSATAGEANLLLQRWNVAAECYQAARQHPLFQSFHRTSMRRQVIRIVYCHQRLGIADFGPFNNLNDVFPPSDSDR